VLSEFLSAISFVDYLYNPSALTNTDLMNVANISPKLWSCVYRNLLLHIIFAMSSGIFLMAVPT